MKSGRARRAASRRARTDGSTSPVPPSLSDNNQADDRPMFRPAEASDPPQGDDKNLQAPRRSTRKRRATPPPLATHTSQKKRTKTRSHPSKGTSSRDEGEQSSDMGSETNSQDRDETDNQGGESVGHHSCQVGVPEKNTENGSGTAGEAPNEVGEADGNSNEVSPVEGIKEASTRAIEQAEVNAVQASESTSNRDATVDTIVPMKSQDSKSAQRGEQVDSKPTVSMADVDVDVDVDVDERGDRSVSGSALTSHVSSAMTVKAESNGVPSQPAVMRVPQAPAESFLLALADAACAAETVQIGKIEPNSTSQDPKYRNEKAHHASDGTSYEREDAGRSRVKSSDVEGAESLDDTKQPSAIGDIRTEVTPAEGEESSITRATVSLVPQERSIPAVATISSDTLEAATGLADLLAGTAPAKVNETAAVSSAERLMEPRPGPMDTRGPSFPIEARSATRIARESVDMFSSSTRLIDSKPLAAPPLIAVGCYRDDAVGPVSDMPVNRESGTDSRKRLLDISSTQMPKKARTEPARIESATANRSIYDAASSRLADENDSIVFNFPPVERIRTQLLDACFRVHRGNGAGKRFAEYWNTLSRYLCHDVLEEDGLGIASLKEAGSVLDSFLTTKTMRKLHNRLVTALLERTMSPFSDDPRLQDCVPDPWRRRLRIVSKDESSENASSSEPLRSSLTERTLSDLDLSLSCGFDLASDVWVSGVVGDYISVDVDHNMSCVRPWGRDKPSVSGVRRVSSSLPGALVIDPVIRRLVKAHDGMKVAENAIWLLIVSVRAYVKSAIEKTARHAKSIEEGGTLPALQLSQVALHTGKTVPESSAKSSLEAIAEVTSSSPPHIRDNESQQRVMNPYDIAGYLAGIQVSFGEALSGSESRLAYERAVFASFDQPFPRGPASLQSLNTFTTKTIREMARHIDSQKKEAFQVGSSMSMDPDSTSRTPPRRPSPRPLTGEQARRMSSGGMGRGAKDLAALKARAEAAARGEVESASTVSDSVLRSGGAPSLSLPSGPLTSRSTTPVTTNTSSDRGTERVEPIVTDETANHSSHLANSHDPDLPPPATSPSSSSNGLEAAPVGVSSFPLPSPGLLERQGGQISLGPLVLAPPSSVLGKQAQSQNTTTTSGTTALVDIDPAPSQIANRSASSEVSGHNGTPQPLGSSIGSLVSAAPSAADETRQEKDVVLVPSLPASTSGAN